MASVDDVFNLLNAVNRETLKRMEDKNDRAFADLRAGLNAELGDLRSDLQKVMRKLDIPVGPSPPPL